MGTDTLSVKDELEAQRAIQNPSSKILNLTLLFKFDIVAVQNPERAPLTFIDAFILLIS